MSELAHREQREKAGWHATFGYGIHFCIGAPLVCDTPEIQAILSCLHALGDQPHVLAGDLNTVHPADQADASACVATQRARGEEPRDPLFPRQVIPFLLEAGHVDCYRTLHPTTPGYTSYTDYPAFRVDYIFACPSFANYLSACDVVTGMEAERASDHFPIWAEFR